MEFLWLTGSRKIILSYHKHDIKKITKVIIKNEYAAGGSGSTKNKTGIKKILATRVNALVNKTLSLDFFKRIFHVTWHAAPDKIAKNKKLSNSYNPIKS